MPELAFALGPDAAPSLADLARALAAEVSRQDAVATVVDAPPVPRPDRVSVLFDGPPSAAPVPDPGRTIVVVTAAPGTARFDAAADLAGRAGASFHVNSAAVAALHQAGVPARHLQLGHSGDWPRREPADEGLAVIAGDGYFDWVEALAAIHRGAVVLHERCFGMAPLVAGRHVFVAAPDSLALLAEILRGEPGRLAPVREEAEAFVAAALPLALAAAALIGSARMVAAQPPAVASSGAQPAL